MTGVNDDQWLGRGHEMMLGLMVRQVRHRFAAASVGTMRCSLGHSGVTSMPVGLFGHVRGDDLTAMTFMRGTASKRCVAPAV
jgi:hypothetical protein